MAQARQFTAVDAKLVRKPKPLLIGITSPSGGGKTFSALKLAAGMQRVLKGKTKLVDTESGRSLQYQHLFDFQYVDFPPPHSPEAYEQAIQFCIADKETTVIIVDSMSHEHGGDGGVLDQIEDFLEKKAGNDYTKRDKLKFTAMVEPKRQRKMLNNTIEQLGGRVVFIFCYRANDKIKPVRGGEPIHMGWTAETTSTLPYMMTVRFLLPPGSDGHPNLKPDTEFEKLSIKMPIQFRDWFKPGLQLNEETGERLARWSVGESAPAGSPAAYPTDEAACAAVVAAVKAAATIDLAKAAGADGWARGWTQAQKRRIKAAVDGWTAPKAQAELPTESDAEDEGDAPTPEELAAAGEG